LLFACPLTGSIHRAKLAKIIFHPVSLFSNAMIAIDTKDIVKEKSVNCLSRLSVRLIKITIMI